MSKVKGSNAERELIKMFWSRHWAAARIAGSGSMHFPSPDILAGNKIRQLAVEVKATKEEKKYFLQPEIKQLQNFAQYFGAEPWIAIKFKSCWEFINPEDLEATKTGFVVHSGSLKGLSFEELTGTT